MKTEEEIQLSADLRTIVADQPFAPDIAAIERHGRRRVRRGFALRGLAGLGVVSVAVAGGLVAAGHGSGTAATGGTGAAGQPTTSSTGTAKSGTPKTVAPKLETVAYVRQQIEAALNPSGYLIEAKQTSSDSPGDITTIWTDPRTGGRVEIAVPREDVFLQHIAMQ